MLKTKEKEEGCGVMKLIRKKLRNKIVCAMIPFVVLAYLVVFVFTYSESKAVVEENFMKEIQISKENVNHEMHAELNEIIGLMKNIQTSVENSCKNTQEIEKYILSIADAYLDIIPNGIYCGLEDGTYIDKLWTPDSDWVMKERPWYTEGIKANEVTFGEMYLDASSGDYIISIYANIKNTAGNAIGVISADMSLNTLKNILEEQQVCVSGYTFVVDQYTGIIIGNREEKEWNGKTIEEVESVIIDKLKDIQDTNIYGKIESVEEFYVSADKITDTNFVVVTVVPKEDITAEVSGIRNVSVLTMVVGMLIQIIVICVILVILMKPIPSIDTAINKIKDLDFTTVCDVKSVDELGHIGENMNQLDEKLRQTMKSIRTDVENIDKQSDANMEIAGHLQKAAGIQLESMNNLNCTLNELNEGIHVIAEGAEGLAQNVSDTTQASATVEEKIRFAVSLVGNGKEQIEKMSQTMGEISSVSEEVRSSVGDVAKGIEGINNMVFVIQDIAEQTNLLALNASIEAARAGETGKGFAVVADEIRKLAESCSNSVVNIVDVTKEIKDLIHVLCQKTESSIHAVSIGVNSVNETSLVFKNINDNVKEINRVMGTVNHAIQNINGVITDMAASVEEQTASTQVISETYNQVMSISESFFEDGEKVVAASKELKSMVTEIRKEIQEFKVE